ncbi:hypothetical protein U9M48_035036 [Paspalum notatum var. saurae]|uniref:Subtilisin-chymotrypsin inhibitor-2A n=1 Tax=Paspalum notatum var. saurae TaxID=547442 RepID=A0AAQ3UBP2_PASNO
MPTSTDYSVCFWAVIVKMSSPAAESKAACGGAPLKTEWPELVGCTIKEATERIKAERPELNIVPITVGSVTDKMYNTSRVRLWVDTVAEIPRVG